METLTIAEIKSGVMKTIRKFVGHVSGNVPEPLSLHVGFSNFRLAFLEQKTYFNFSIRLLVGTQTFSPEAHTLIKP